MGSGGDSIRTYNYPTNIASVNLVVGCSKVFIPLICHLYSVSTQWWKKKPYSNPNVDPSHH